MRWAADDGAAATAHRIHSEGFGLDSKESTQLRSSNRSGDAQEEVGYMVLVILCVVGWVLAALSVWAAYRFYRRAVIYDEVFQYISSDIETNLAQFRQMSASNIMSNEPTIQDAHKKMMIMGKRLNEILSRMEEATGLDLRPPPPPPRPKVI